MRKSFIVDIAVALVGLSAGFWFSWYAMETGNGKVLLAVFAFLALGLADLVRRWWKASR
ncbi:hypothetical protein [Nonomuraea sp. NPDC005650]|uniref:hypothetical protein n=1 Tax=Nonomuraea sp. NPDC005650 TaxID=3157045 RepID=UPI0033A4EB1B